MDVFVDVSLLITFVVAALFGWFKGLLWGLSFLAAGIVSSWFTLAFSPNFTTFFSAAPSTPFNINAGIAVFILFLIVFALSNALFLALITVFKKLLKTPIVSAFNSALGAFFGITAWFFMIWILGGFSLMSSFSILHFAAGSSKVIQFINAAIPIPPEQFIDNFQNTLNQAGVPTVFSETPNLPQVNSPNENVPQAVFAIQESVIKIFAPKSACQIQSTGSGWVALPEIIITNAHVVAGADWVSVREPNSRSAIKANIIAFDPDNDLAILHAPGLQAPPLKRGSALQKNDDAFALGYPGGGNLTISPQRIRDAHIASGTNIYDDTAVTREIYSLRGIIRQGNSGGPLVNPSGEVVGTIFATSDHDPETGFSLKMPPLDALIASSDMNTVPNGTCQTR